GVHEARHDGAPAQIDDPGVAVAPPPHVGGAAHRGDARTGDGERGGDRTAGIDGEDAAVDENSVRGYRFTRGAGPGPGRPPPGSARAGRAGPTRSNGAP